MWKLFKNYGVSILLSLIIFGEIILIFGGRYISFLSNRYRSKEIPVSQPKNDFKSNGGVQNFVVPKSSFDGPAINYFEQGFDKPEVEINRPSCSLEIYNKSTKPLTLRLGPYELSQKSNYGEKYPDIEPGSSMLIDPRYGRPREEYLNYQNPSQIFYTNIDPSCLPIPQ